ncbi:OmpA family protein [Psychrobacter sp. AH5]|uniref:OmpA family protein n=1 Tax=Psychrobacter sp. AH5 TaxID=2937433 RepID=UPI00334114A7
MFDTDKSVVKPEYFSEVAEVADFYEPLCKHYDSHRRFIPIVKVVDSYNQALSQRRVNAVRDVLINQFGIAADRLTAIGYGESRPRATNDTAEGRQLNRRVVALIKERRSN